MLTVRKWMAGVLVACGLLFAGSITTPDVAGAAVEQIAEFNVAGWDIGAFSDGGQFQHCSAIAEYDGGVSIIARVDRHGAWTLAFAKKAWKFEPDATFTVRLRVDGLRWFEFKARIGGVTEMLYLTMDQHPQFSELFRHGRELEVMFPKFRDIFRLDGTSKMLPAVAECASQYVAKEEQNAAESPSASGGNTLLDSFTVGVWSGGAYARTSDGRFNHCEVSRLSSYKTHVLLGLGVEFGWMMGFIQEDWNYRKGEGPIPVRLRLDLGEWMERSVKAVTSVTLQLTLNDDVDFLRKIASGRRLELDVGGEVYRFNLRDMERALDGLMDCAEDYIKDGGGSGPNVASVGPDSGAPDPDSNEPGGASSGPRLVSSGTGIVVSRKGHVLTNDHVIDECGAVAVGRVGEAPQPAEFIAADPTNDLAVLRSKDGFDGDFASFRIGRAVPAGERVAVFGFPISALLSPTGNLVEGNIASVAGMLGNINQFQISAPVQPGNSGGPLLDFRGSVVGVIQSKLGEKYTEISGDIPQNVNFAIKGSVAMTFLDTHSIEYETADAAASTLDLVGVGSAAKAFTVIVLCLR